MPIIKSVHLIGIYMYCNTLHRTYQLFQSSYELVVLNIVALGNHSHTVKATGSKEMSTFEVC